ncbi:hypothetical protein L9F63_016407, partial [Diploptera punctata]
GEPSLEIIFHLSLNENCRLNSVLPIYCQSSKDFSTKSMAISLHGNALSISIDFIRILSKMNFWKMTRVVDIRLHFQILRALSL